MAVFMFYIGVFSIVFTIAAGIAELINYFYW
jgi:hypothetical protein